MNVIQDDVLDDLTGRENTAHQQITTMQNRKGNVPKGRNREKTLMGVGPLASSWLFQDMFLDTVAPELCGVLTWNNGGIIMRNLIEGNEGDLAHNSLRFILP